MNIKDKYLIGSLVYFERGKNYNLGDDVYETTCNYQGIDIGNLDDTFTRNIHPNMVFNTLKQLRLNNLNKVVIAHPNINSIREKFEQLSFIIRDIVDILVVGETKLDDTFPKNQFLIKGFSQPMTNYYLQVILTLRKRNLY